MLEIRLYLGSLKPCCVYVNRLQWRNYSSIHYKQQHYYPASLKRRDKLLYVEDFVSHATMRGLNSVFLAILSSVISKIIQPFKQIYLVGSILVDATFYLLCFWAFLIFLFIFKRLFLHRDIGKRQWYWTNLQ